MRTERFFTQKERWRRLSQVQVVFLIWRGWGILGILIPLVALGFGAMLGLAISPSGAAVGVLVAIFGIAGAATVWVVGERLNNSPGRLLVDPATGEKVLLRSSHTLFWVPLQWWAPAALLFSFFLAFAMAQQSPKAY
jgi:hypothetical protein